MIVDKPVFLESYPRINAHNQMADLRINAHKSTHKRSHISCSTYMNPVIGPAALVHNADALHTATPERGQVDRTNRQAVPGMF
jgi:hypothetical protein